MMEVFAGFLSHTDHHLGRLLDFLRERGDLDNTIVMVISDNGASAEGGPTGTTNEAQFFNNAQEPLEDSLKADRRDRRPEALQPLPVGLDLGRQHAVPAVEAGDLPRRRLGPVHRVTGPRGSRPRARSAPSTRTSSTWCRPSSTCSSIDPPATIRGVTQSPIQGVSFAHTFDAPAAASRHRTQYFEMLGHRAIYHDGWRAVCPWPGPVVHRGRHRIRATDLGARSCPSSTAAAGSSTTSTRTSPRTTTSPPTTATSSSS